MATTWLLEAAGHTDCLTHTQHCRDVGTVGLDSGCSVCFATWDEGPLLIRLALLKVDFLKKGQQKWIEL